MKKTQTSLLFSAKRDPDLLELYRQVGRKNFILILKESMRMLTRPGYKGMVLESTKPYPRKYDGDDMKLTFSLSSEKDKDIAEMLRNVGERKSGIFIKTAMRMAIGPYFCLGCLIEGENALNEDYKDRKLFFLQVSEIKAKKAKTPAVKKPKEAKEKDFSWDDVFDEKEESFLTVSDGDGENRAAKEEPSKAENLDNKIVEAEPSAAKEPAENAPALRDTETSSSASEEFSEDDVLSLLENM